MTAAIGTIIKDWMIPRMGVRHIIVDPYVGNQGSVRVFEKNGFVQNGTIEKEWVTNAGIKHVGMHTLSWELKQ